MSDICILSGSSSMSRKTPFLYTFSLKSHAVVLSYTSLHPSARLGTSALGGSGCHDPGPGSSFCRLGTTYDRRSSVPRRPSYPFHFTHLGSIS